jgi:hypothetical protein
LEAWKLGSLEALYNFHAALPSLFPSGCAFLSVYFSRPLWWSYGEKDMNFCGLFARGSR